MTMEKVIKIGLVVAAVPLIAAIISRELNYGAFKWAKKVKPKSPLKPVLYKKDKMAARVGVKEEISDDEDKIRAEYNQLPLLMFFGGSFDTAYNSVARYSHLFKDVVFCSPDYYGTQDSEGRMNLDTMKKTAEDFYDTMTAEAPGRKIIVCGYSYGTGMATYLASVRKVDRLILVSAYRDSADLYNIYAPFFHGIFKYFIRDNIRVTSYAENVTCPTYIIGSERDRQLKAHIQRKLQRSFSNATVKIFDEPGHKDYFDDPEVIDYIQNIIEECIEEDSDDVQEN